MPDYPVSALHPEVRLFLVKNRRFFGAGPFRLLSLLQKSQSLSDACKKMNLSYSKGLRIINNIEEELGIKVVVKTRGGSKGGQTTLTAAGRELLARYESFSKECQQIVRDRFYKYFGEAWE